MNSIVQIVITINTKTRFSCITQLFVQIIRRSVITLLINKLGVSYLLLFANILISEQLRNKGGRKKSAQDKYKVYITQLSSRVHALLYTAHYTLFCDIPSHNARKITSNPNNYYGSREDDKEDPILSFPLNNLANERRRRGGSGGVTRGEGRGRRKGRRTHERARKAAKENRERRDILACSSETHTRGGREGERGSLERGERGVIKGVNINTGENFRRGGGRSRRREGERDAAGGVEASYTLPVVDEGSKGREIRQRAVRGPVRERRFTAADVVLVAACRRSCQPTRRPC